jgi:hypothetical protein
VTRLRRIAVNVAAYLGFGVLISQAACGSAQKGEAAFKACSDAVLTQAVGSAGQTLQDAVNDILAKDDADLELDLATLGIQVGAQELGCVLDGVDAAAGPGSAGSGTATPLLVKVGKPVSAHALARARLVQAALSKAGD